MKNEERLISILQESENKQLRTQAFLEFANSDHDKNFCTIDGREIEILNIEKVILSLVDSGKLIKISETNFRLNV